MVSIEQVKLLESRVIKTIDFVDQVREENTLLKNKLESCQKRVDELEVLIQRFKEDQAKIEDSIVSALDRLNKFEDDIGTAPVRSKSAQHSVSAHSAPAKRRPEPEPEPEDDIDIEEDFVLKEKSYNPEEDEIEDSKKELEIF